MPTLVIENMPQPLFDEIQRLAFARNRTPADIVLEMLKMALRTITPAPPLTLLSDEPILAEESSEAFNIPRPVGVPVKLSWIHDYFRKPHDNLDEV
jgi:hypothetical protein